MAEGNNRFAFDLYSQLAKVQRYSSGNLFFSPFSLSSALAITYEGAEGKTAEEIRSVFYFPENDTARREGFSALNAGINSADPLYALRTANALWAEKTYPFLPEYTGTAERYYGAKTANLDFIGHPEESRVTINTWVEDKTEDRIIDLIPSGVIDPMTRLVITNAIYFKGEWVKQFDKNKTADAEFRRAPGKTVTVPMMQRTDDDAVFLYAETSDLQLLSMPYEQTAGKELSMVILLPRSDDLTTTEASLSAVTLTTLQRAATPRRVMTYLPKFTLETKYSLPDTLSAMGMPTAFTGNADFSGMDGTKNLIISDVIHQAFVDVNEEGTEASAATAVVVKLAAAPGGSGPIPVFRADHPFIFLIQENETGSILFMGRVMNPTGS
ncbi:MAG: serpin family protein [Methanoregulaceae archaeon]|nr:serpin family protein [Methanoregulaceae archaeon]